MTIQFNTDKNIASNDRTANYLSSIVSDSLERFSEHVTRIEVHLSDENGSGKTGGDDKRCVLEARMEGKKPVAVTNDADTIEKAVRGAIDKLTTMLEKSLDRQRSY